MNILTIPLRNCRRRWLRTLLLLVVFTAGVASIVSLTYVSKVVGHSLEKKLTAFGANILIQPKTESLTVSYGGFALGNLLYDIEYLPQADTVARIESIEFRRNVSVIAPKLVIMARMGEESGAGVGFVGVDWEQEKAIKSYWSVAGRYPAQPDEVLAGAKAADKYNLGPGTKIETAGAVFTVAGVLDPTGGEDDNVILADLTRLQATTDKQDQVNFIEVAALCSGCPIEDIVKQIEAKLPTVEVKALKSVIEQRMFSIEFTQNLMLAVSLVILLTACSMIGLSMLSAVNERKKEIGVLRSLGYSKANIFSIFCSEALFLGLAAGALGYPAGYALSLRILDALNMLGDHHAAFAPGEFGLACLAFALVSVLSAALPSWKASRVEPSEALIAL